MRSQPMVNGRNRRDPSRRGTQGSSAHLKACGSRLYGDESPSSEGLASKLLCLSLPLLFRSWPRELLSTLQPSRSPACRRLAPSRLAATAVGDGAVAIPFSRPTHLHPRGASLVEVQEDARSKKRPARPGVAPHSSEPGPCGKWRVCRRAVRRNAEDAPAIEKRIVAADDDSDELESELETDEVAREETAEPFGEEVELDTALEGHIDDPVRMYLMQMGEIPLLSRAEEIAVGQGNRAHADAFPPQHVGQRLFAARRRARS